MTSAYKNRGEEQVWPHETIARELATGNDIQGGTPLAAVPHYLSLDSNSCRLLGWCYGGEALSSQGLERLTLEFTSVRRCVVMSLMRSWRVEDKALLGQVKVWSVVNGIPHGQ